MYKEDSYLRGTRRRRSGLFQGLLAVFDYPGMEAASACPTPCQAVRQVARHI